RDAAQVYDQTEKEVAAEADKAWARAQTEETGRYEEQIQELERANSDFVSTLRHQLDEAVSLSKQQAEELINAGRLQVNDILEASKQRADNRRNALVRAARWLHGYRAQHEKRTPSPGASRQ